MSFEENLIKAVREHPILYNKKDEHFRRSDLKDTIWSEIAFNLNRSDNSCKNKWKNLRDTFQRNSRLLSKILPGTSTEDSIRLKQWKYYDSLSFLSSGEERHGRSQQSSSSLGNFEVVDVPSRNISPPKKKIKLEIDEDGQKDEYFENSLDSIQATSVSNEPPITPTAMLFLAMAKKIEDANLSKAALNKMERDVVNFIYEKLESIT